MCRLFVCPMNACSSLPRAPLSVDVLSHTHACTRRPRASAWLLRAQWQAGVITALQERYNLSSVDFVGASAGSLAATLAACDADMDLAMTLALDLCDKNEVNMKRGGRGWANRTRVPLSQADTLPATLLHTGCTQEETHFSVLLLYAQQRRILLNNSFENWRLLSFRCTSYVDWCGWDVACADSCFTLNHRSCNLLNGSCLHLYFEPPQLICSMVHVCILRVSPQEPCEIRHAPISCGAHRCRSGLGRWGLLVCGARWWRTGWTNYYPTTRPRFVGNVSICW